ncbi:MAG: hypothetical protein NTU91_01155 [Chloroflexi bacterium]|nr:hypothetical protein [Chloroflexota bacterium]
MAYIARTQDDPNELGRSADQQESVLNDEYFYHCIRYLCIEVVDKDTLLTTGGGKKAFHIPPEVSGMNLVYVHAFNLTPSAVGIPTFQIANVTDATVMLSTKLTIDATETGSNTAAVPAVIDTTKDDVVTNDILAVNVDVAGSTTKGVYITVGFGFP